MEEGAENTAARRSSTPEKPYEDDGIEEYSYHDEPSASEKNAGVNKEGMAVQKDNESDIEEDYEF
jgi:hypothetical protein